jgi:hypothetical protein
LCHFWARKLYGQSGVQQSQYAGRDLFPHQWVLSSINCNLSY